METKLSITLQIVTVIIVSVGIFLGFLNIGMKNYTKGLKQFTILGFIPLALIAGIRHIFFPGDILAGQSKFFEFEAGGANLAVAVAAILALSMKMDNKTLGVIYVTYAVYLLVSCIAWALFIGDGSKKYIMLGMHVCIIAILLYFAYIAFNHGEDE